MKPKIIIVKEELVIALDIKEILEQEGHEVIINITSSEQAMLAITQHHPDLLLIDTHLSNDSEGILLGNYLKNNSTIPYIYITSHNNTLKLKELKESNPAGIILKPYKVAEIKDTVAMALHYAQKKNVEQ